MSESLRPWIATYLVEVAESFSGLLNVKAHTRGKKVQLVEFLTYKQSENDNCIWAVASDKQLEIPVCLKGEALEMFYPPGYVSQSGFHRISLTDPWSDHQDSQTKELVEYRGALAIIKSFKPIFRRIPKRGGGLTAADVLSLEVDGLSITGCIGEPTFGSPREVSSQALLKEWIEGLRKGGRGGFVLREKREMREHREAENEPIAGSSKTTRGAVEKLPKTLDSIVENKQSVDFKNSYRNRWSKIRRDKKRYSGPPVDASVSLGLGAKHIPEAPRPATVTTGTSTALTPDSERKRRNRQLALDFSPSSEGVGALQADEEDEPDNDLFDDDDDDLDEGRARENHLHRDVGAKDGHLQTMPSTPSQWSQSSPPRPFPTHLEEDNDHHHSSTHSPTQNSGLRPLTAADTAFSSSYLSPPTPAQRPRPTIFSSSLPTSTPPRSSRPHSNLNKAESLPALGGLDKRHIPLPVVPPTIASSSQVQGNGNVLVPNSDTSGTASQSQHTQSQSQRSQKRSGGLGWSQGSSVLGKVGTSLSLKQNAAVVAEDVPMLENPQLSVVVPHARTEDPSIGNQTRRARIMDDGFVDASALSIATEQGRSLDVDDAITHTRLAGVSPRENSSHALPSPSAMNISRSKRPRSPSIRDDRHTAQKKRRTTQQKDVHDAVAPRSTSSKVDASSKQVARNLKMPHFDLERTRRLATYHRPKLGGFQPNYSLGAGDGSAFPLLTWKTVQEIIHRTAQMRSAEDRVNSNHARISP
ncbi:hypothetical protein OF83DRAFT_1294939 [Amylostereum chailletii]|nr:hypothetical protein OF83DRAFT_1294939 [Amylostereum chailletii]